jgi:glucosamine-6-phosphate deaminase
MLAASPAPRGPGFRVETFATRADMGRAAGEAAAREIAARLARQPSVRVMFAAAPSQQEMLATLTAATGIAWPRVTAFHLDEFVGLSDQAPQRYARWLDRHLFARVAFGRVERMRPDPDPEVECRRYAAVLAEAPIDLICLGIGVNGHIAYNDPPFADFHDPLDVKTVALDAASRQQMVDEGAFASLADVPTRAITITVPRLMRAGRLICTVPGAAKRAAVAACLRGKLTPACPASILPTHENCTMFLDRDSNPDG